MTKPFAQFDVAIAGAGPAGSSAAIHLALAGRRVLLVEVKKFPRAKLCGEFISPECVTHFKSLGVADEMMSAGGASISKTVFYTRRGHSINVPSEWFKSGTNAIGLSRSEMDYRLLERAKSLGVVVLEEAQAAGLLQEREDVKGIKVKTDGSDSDYFAEVTIDATGRSRALAHYVDQAFNKKRPALVAFKAHMKDASVAEGACEIYFYEGGYGGLSGVEGGLGNLCFIVSAEKVRRYSSVPELVMRKVVMKNSRAAYTLEHARAQTGWLAVSLENFGRRTLVPAPGLLTIGDAASFIDPFTGSGMLMALESGQVAAETINRYLARRCDPFESLSREYRAEYSKKFDARLRVSGILRRAAFVPRLAEVAILLCGASSYLRRKLARATRHSATHEISAPSG